MENQKRMTNIERDLKGEIKKLSDRLNLIEGKIHKNKIQYINVVSNENLSSYNYNKNDSDKEQMIESKTKNGEGPNITHNNGKSKIRYNGFRS